jgi:hypothetical protein
MKIGLIVCMTAMMTACASAPAHGERAAVMIEPSAASRAELLKTVRAALNNAPLILADDALSKDSVLSIEPQQRLDPNGLLANGRELGRPERFLLSTDGKRCLLTHERTRQQWLLVHAQCKARD